MSNLLRATLIGAAIFASTSAVLALDGDANPVPNNGAYFDQDSYLYSNAARYSPFWMTPARANGPPVRALTASERRAFNRANGPRWTLEFGTEAAFTNVAGQLRFTIGLVEGDVNGDGAADSQIELDVLSVGSAESIL